MPLLTSQLNASDGFVDAYTHTLEPNVSFGAIDPDHLKLGTNGSDVYRTWIGWVGGTAFSLPPGASVQRAILKLRLHIPSYIDASDSFDLVIKRVMTQLSEANVDETNLSAAELAVGNWPLEELDRQTIQWDVIPTADWSPTSSTPTHFTRVVDLDVTSWWERTASDPGQLPTLGFILEIENLPNDPLGHIGIVYVDPHSLPTSLVEQQTVPQLALHFGYPVTTASVPELTSRRAFLTWPASPNADYYLVQYSTDGGSSWSQLPSASDNFTHVELDEDTIYTFRVAAAYEGAGQVGDFCPPVAYITPDDTASTTFISSPPAPSVDFDVKRQQVNLVLPSSSADNPDMDRWQIARLRGAYQAGAGITFVDLDANFQTGGSTTLTKPAATVNNDLLITYLITFNSALTPPAGWTQLKALTVFSNSGGDAHAANVYIYYRIASAEPVNYTWTWSGTDPFGSILHVWRGVDVVSPFIDSALTVFTPTNSSDLVRHTPSVDPGGIENSMQLIGTFLRDSAGMSFEPGDIPVTKFGVDIFTFPHPADLGRSIHVGRRSLPSGDPTGTHDLNQSDFTTADNYAGFQLLLRPSATLNPTPDNDDVLAEVGIFNTDWTDRYPVSGPASYYVRGRIDPRDDTWTPWSQPASYTPPISPRANLLYPNNTIELVVATKTGRSKTVTFGGAVETAMPSRISVAGGDVLELVVNYRCDADNAYTDVFRSGIRWYDRNSVVIPNTTTYTDVLFDFIGNSSPADILTRQYTAPAGAFKAGVFLELISNSGSTMPKVRIEAVDLFRVDEDHDTGWEYVQIPDDAGNAVDTRVGQIDQSGFVYDGVGWSELRNPPAASASGSPYQETFTAGDEFSFTNVGQWLDLLFYGSPQGAQIQINRLSDSALQNTLIPNEELWNPIIDPSIGTFVYDVNLVANPNGDAGITGWTTSIVTSGGNDTGLNASGAALFTNPGALTVGSTSYGTNHFSTNTGTPGDGASYPLANLQFQAGHTYHGQIVLRNDNAGARQYTLMLGTRSPYVAWAGNGLVITDYALLQDAGLTIGTIQAGDTIIVDVYWTPRTDIGSAFIVLRGDGAIALQNVSFNNVTVQEVLGYQLPPVSDFSIQTVSIPSYFSANLTTPYMVKLLSGTMRPLGLKRDVGSTVDLVSDFDTVLRALGNLRNATAGELEFRSDLTPPQVLHWMLRGIDHTTITGGLDLRRGKNIVTSKRTLDSGPIVNRLLVVGYGDDRTQLVYEVRSQLDRQGRPPSDPWFRYDRFGRSPFDPGWDLKTGGTSEEIYGTRYGTYKDATVTSLLQAQTIGSALVELSAWPADTFDVTAADLAEVPAALDVGDIVPIRYRDQDLLRRILSIRTDVSQPRALGLTLGENVTEMPTLFERVTKDLETVMSFINTTTGAANNP